MPLFILTKPVAEHRRPTYLEVVEADDADAPIERAILRRGGGPVDVWRAGDLVNRGTTYVGRVHVDGGIDFADGKVAPTPPDPDGVRALVEAAS